MKLKLIPGGDDMPDPTDDPDLPHRGRDHHYFLHPDQMLHPGSFLF
jgi:hypothetical protein